ncbi:hypothetical protein AArcCO_0461 [Halalkaliarchaeum sp. AArc-CO]|uniref:hypothetical protein n=1 Tax=unclassified Halalkaliarchaeum TaxID=2678344 RepID=UPI00217DC969|nr:MULTISPECIES: hypothetical protein [unclassified Halalkaliarchaeum]MDR5673528.1 hypothetical protein [Halalkaliarchaeum sp. AArc-GB]UWG49785.1 hypothetical protein AArcCO_0461 [Halalkaliarchaeum sp. AArc-CO]
MSVLDTIRSWVRSLFGGESPEPADGESAETTDPESEREPGLDPDGVTEVRVERDDDPIDRLREVKQQRAEESAEGDHGDREQDEPDRDEDGSGEGDLDAP